MRSKSAKKFFFVIALIIITFLSFLFRFKGITNNHPFWVDEYSSAHQARYILQYGAGVFKSINKPPIYFEDRNITVHFLIAIFFKLFGQKEWIARIPIVFIGTLVPGAVALLARKLFGYRVAILSGLFTALSYYEITWSRQARGYMLQQLLTVLTIYWYIRLQENKTKNLWEYFIFVLLIVMGATTHPIFYLVIISLAIHYLITNPIERLILFLKKPLTYIVLLIFVGIGIKIGIFSTILTSITKVNNLWYYHAFLWREYGLITFLAIVGLFMSTSRRQTWSLLIGVYIFSHLIFLCYILSPYTSRYLNTIFPFLLLFAAYAIITISDLSIINMKNKNYLFYLLMSLTLSLLIIFDRNKFVVKPKWTFYSVNHDFREIALIDYHQIYTLMKTKGEFTNHQTAIIETWPDRLHWYMGQDFFDAYEFKWKSPGVINGIPTGSSPYYVNDKGEKMTKRYPKMGFINELPDLKKAMIRYSKGFLFIDDSSLPRDVIDYAEKNLKKELYLDHYPLDDNPYSIWPATLYSWGIK